MRITYVFWNAVIYFVVDLRGPGNGAEGAGVVDSGLFRIVEGGSIVREQIVVFDEGNDIVGLPLDSRVEVRNVR